MNNPSQAQWQTVIDNLYSVLPFAIEDEALDMGEACVNIGHECATVHCFGGWYAIAHYKEKAFSKESYRIPLRFNDGAQQIAQDLGFSNFTRLEAWAAEHPDLWGNPEGKTMFWNPFAFNHGKGGAKNIADIINHLEFVKENCQRLEQRR